MAYVAPLPDGEISFAQALAASVEKKTTRSTIMSALLSHMMDLISNHKGHLVKCLIKAAFSGTSRSTKLTSHVSGLHATSHAQQVLSGLIVMHIVMAVVVVAKLR